MVLQFGSRYSRALQGRIFPRTGFFHVGIVLFQLQNPVGTALRQPIWLSFVRIVTGWRLISASRRSWHSGSTHHHITFFFLRLELPPGKLSNFPRFHPVLHDVNRKLKLTNIASVTLSSERSMLRPATDRRSDKKKSHFGLCGPPPHEQRATFKIALWSNGQTPAVFVFPPFHPTEKNMFWHFSSMTLKNSRLVEAVGVERWHEHFEKS